MFILALLPILFLIVFLIFLKKPAVLIAPLTLLLTIGLAFFIWNQDLILISLASLEGFIYGLWPVGIIILGSITLSNLMVKSGSVQKIQDLISHISSDVRIMVVLVSWGLESFLESIAGFGSGLALPISVLTIMGVSPIKAGVVALLANSVPTAYGGVGIGISALSRISNIPLAELMQTIAIQLFIPSIIMPFLIVWVITESWSKVREIFWVPLFAGLGQGLGLMIPLSAPMVAVCSGLMNIGGGILATYIFYPHLREQKKINVKEAVKTLLPFLIAVFLILVTGPLVPPINQLLSSFKSEFAIYPNGKPLVIYWFTDAGILLLLSGIIGTYIQGLSFKQIAETSAQTLLQLRKTLIVLVSILAMARVMTYSGMIDTLSTGFSTIFGVMYPVFSPLLGTIGVFITGSVTSSGILMGSLQAEMGNMLSITPAWLVAMNASGSTAGKMLAPHSVAIVMAAIGSSSEEARITTIVFKFLLLYVGILMMISVIGSYLF